MLDIDEMREILAKKYYGLLSPQDYDFVISAREEDDFWEVDDFLQTALLRDIHIDDSLLAEIKDSIPMAFPKDMQPRLNGWIAKHEERNAALAKQ